MTSAYRQLELITSFSTIEIRTRQLESVEVAVAWRNEAFAIHHSLMVGRDEDDKVFDYLDLTRWSLTHIPTGIGILHNPDKDLLIRKARDPKLLELLALVDFDDDGRPLLSPSLQRELRKFLLTTLADGDAV